MAPTTVGLSERLLSLLDQAAVATTYKYALLLALIDATLRGTDEQREPPEQIPVSTLAQHALELYWPHTDPYPGSGEVLRQSGTGQAEVLTTICRFRTQDPASRITLAAARYSTGFDRPLRAATWKLAEMPLPRLQRVGNQTDPFLNSIGWDETITRRTFERDDFDRSVRLMPDVGAELCRLGPLLRPLTERLWASRVVVYNRFPEGRLDEFLFRRARLDATRVHLALFEMHWTAVSTPTARSLPPAPTWITSCRSPDHRSTPSRTSSWLSDGSIGTRVITWPLPSMSIDGVAERFPGWRPSRRGRGDPVRVGRRRDRGSRSSSVLRAWTHKPSLVGARPVRPSRSQPAPKRPRLNRPQSRELTATFQPDQGLVGRGHRHVRDDPRFRSYYKPEDWNLFIVRLSDFEPRGQEGLPARTCSGQTARCRRPPRGW